MVLSPCTIGTGEKPNCECGPLSYSFDAKDNKCVCKPSSSYDVNKKSCSCNPGTEERLGTFGPFCYVPHPPRPDEKPRGAPTPDQNIAIGVLAGLAGLAALVYIGVLASNYIAANYPPPIVQAVAQPAAPAAIVPGLVMQNNPMIGANV